MNSTIYTLFLCICITIKYITVSFVSSATVSIKKSFSISSLLCLKPHAPPPPQSQTPPTISPHKIITVSPAGLKGFYIMGVITYIKEHYDLTDYVFSGASAGAWNALFLAYNGNDPYEFAKKILETSFIKKNSFTCLADMENKIKQYLLENYKNEDFDLNKLNVGGVIIMDIEKHNNLHTNANNNPHYTRPPPHRFQIQSYVPTYHTHIYNQFTDLEDAIKCCIGSSHIPVLSNGQFQFFPYKNQYVVDGGFSENPYICPVSSSHLHITPDMWDFRGNNGNKNQIEIFMDLFAFLWTFPRKEGMMMDLFKKGYTDCEYNKYRLDRLFSPVSGGGGGGGVGDE